MKIKIKILGMLLTMSLLVLLVGALAVDRQRASVMTTATKEAENVAGVLGFIFLSDSNLLHASTQEIITRLHQTQGRDVVLMDTRQTILADAVTSEVGKNYTDDPNDEAGATIKDGKPRTFTETSADYPMGIRQIVVPIKSSSGQIIGAVILEYTPLYNELMQLTKTTMEQIAAAAVGSVAFAFLIAFFMGRSVARPLHQLTAVATAFAAGKTDVPMPPPRADEIGDLARAFENMLQKREQAEEALRRARDELEVRVAERTADLAKTNKTLGESEEKFRQLADNIADVFWITSPDFKTIHYISPGYELIWGRSMDSLYANPHQWVEAILPEERDRAFGIFGTLMTNTPKVSVEYQISRPDGSIRWIHDRGFQVRDAAGNLIRLTGIASDITERKRLETRLFQSQKMETVGKLAGGIAHEFNSIMTAIIGRSELLIEDLTPENPLAQNAVEIRKAAERAATLTRQLLAYGRKQILQPEMLDLSAVITGMKNTLLHLMGRNVELGFNFGAGVKAVKADVGQIEQVIVNIAMNAAEAMPNGGKLTLETANVTLDAGYVSHFPELKAGEYTMLAIGDTGPGMSDEVKARVFEPFFTTKGVGEGPGLGLSTCHGIVKQSGGHIAVYSEPGRGTTFKVYLPQVEPKIETKLPARLETSQALPRGTETILLVEDDSSLREMAATMLERWGYTVFAAVNGVEAMTRVHQPGRGHIDLLFTDVVMPHMSGKELADRIRVLHPQTKVLFASAYTESAIVHQGVLNSGVALLQKPYTPSVLAYKLREILDGQAPSTGLLGPKSQEEIE